MQHCFTKHNVPEIYTHWIKSIKQSAGTSILPCSHAKPINETQTGKHLYFKKVKLEAKQFKIIEKKKKGKNDLR